MKKLHFLILGSLVKGALEHIFIKNFEKNNLVVSSLDLQTPIANKINKYLLNKVFYRTLPSIFYSELNKAVISLARKVRPDVIFIFKGQELYPDTIKELRLLTRLIVNYNPDHPLTYFSKGSGNSNVLNSVTLFDLYFTYSNNIESKLKKLNVNAFCIPFGYDNDIKPEELTNTNYQDDFIFIGAYDKQRDFILNQISIENFRIFGPNNWLKSKNNLNYQGMALYELDYYSANRNSLGAINLLREQNLSENSHNMRTFEIPGTGGLQITQRTKEQLEFFEEDSEAIFFSTIEELNDKLKFLNSSKDLINKIKIRAYERCVRSNYSYFHRVSNIIDIVNMHLSEQ